MPATQRRFGARGESRSDSEKSDSDLCQQRARRASGKQRNRFEAASPGAHFGGAYRGVDVVVSALDDDVRVALQDKLQWGLFLEWHDQAHRFECGENRHPVIERIERPVGALVEL